MNPPSASPIHPSAIIDPGATIGPGTRVWHFSHVSPGAVIGARCTLGQNVFVADRVRIGDEVKIQNNVSVYEGVTLEDRVFCGPSVVFTNVRHPRAAHPRHGVYEPTLVREGATIGANATIRCGTTVGRWAFVAAGATVTRDVPDHALVVGVPARLAGWMSEAGERLDFQQGEATCPATGEVYRLVEGRVERTRVITPPESPRHVPMIDLEAQYRSIQGEILKAVHDVLASQHFILGPAVGDLEATLAAACGCRHAVGVSSGSDALLMSLLAEGIGPGDEVVTTPFTFFATVAAILRVGATPRFVDICPTTFNLDATHLAEAITPRTRAILPVHLFGLCADMEPIMAIARRHGLIVIEDAAQAIRAGYRGSQAGAIGHYGCFSFFPSKNLGGAGDGGMILTDDDARADRLRLLRVQGARPKYHHQRVGGNFRLDTLQAAIVGAKVPHLDRWTDQRRANAARYRELLAPGLAQGNGLLALPHEPAGRRHVFHQFVVRVADRERVRRQLAAEGIATEVYYPVPAHLQPAAASLGLAPGAFPVSERCARECLAIPVHPELSPVALTAVATALIGATGGIIPAHDQRSV